MKEYCNPLNIEYKFQHYGRTAHREAADPTMVYFKGKYYIFASMSAGFYYSEDLVNWQWHENRELDIYRYAPDVHVVGEWLFFCASTRSTPSTFWRTQDPLSNQFEKIAEPFDFWDPSFFADDDGRFYLYWGCGNDPLLGVELDSQSMMPIGEKVIVIKESIASHGWERHQQSGVKKPEIKSFLMNVVAPLLNPKGLPYMEGTFMNKWNGKYYLQYAAPGTELSSYANGVYVAEHPLGPFTYQEHNPFSYRPSGFITGAGHGSTMMDKFGNLWHIATMRISVNASFERRIGLFPAGFDENGTLFCNQNFADYPIVIPEGKFDARELQPYYMLLSYKKQAKVSSSLENHGAELAVNEDIRSWWCANGSAGEWYELDLGKIYSCHSIQLNLAEHGIPTQKHPKAERSKDVSSGYRYVDSDASLHTRTIIEGSIDGENWFVIQDNSQANSDLTHGYIVLPEKTQLRFVKVTAKELAYNQKFAISGLRVFGLDIGEKPEQVSSVQTTRMTALDCEISWPMSPSAIGYNVRYGIAPDNLYTSYQVYEKNKILITSLNADTEYWVCVDSFNESGVTEGNTQKL